jgi:hypothetical protein
MDLNLRVQVERFKKDNRGSFTIEASLVFPILFLVTIGLVLLSLVIYENAVIYHRAHVIAERMAFVWDNSQKDGYTGEFQVNEYTTHSGGDGLYWRTNEKFLFYVNKLPGISISNPVEKKLARGRTMYPEVGISYRPTLVGGEVTVELERSLNLFEYVRQLRGGSSDIHATANASIKDPVEIIRTTELIYHFLERVGHEE